MPGLIREVRAGAHLWGRPGDEIRRVRNHHRDREIDLRMVECRAYATDGVGRNQTQLVIGPPDDRLQHDLLDLRVHEANRRDGRPQPLHPRRHGRFVPIERNRQDHPVGRGRKHSTRRTEHGAAGTGTTGPYGGTPDGGGRIRPDVDVAPRHEACLPAVIRDQALERWRIVPQERLGEREDFRAHELVRMHGKRHRQHHAGDSDANGHPRIPTPVEQELTRGRKTAGYDGPPRAPRCLSGIRARRSPSSGRRSPSASGT